MAEISKRNRTEETNSALNRDKFEIAKQAVYTYLSSRNYSVRSTIFNKIFVYYNNVLGNRNTKEKCAL